jgi:hypothetical protein
MSITSFKTHSLYLEHLANETDAQSTQEKYITSINNGGSVKDHDNSYFHILPKTYQGYEIVDIENLTSLCTSKKLKEWDNANFKETKNYEFLEDEWDNSNFKETKDNNEFLGEEKDQGEQKKFVRHHINSLRKYAEIAIPSDGMVEVIYKKKSNGRYINVNPYGNSYSYTNMYHQIRNLLSYKYYYDIDIQNCHFLLFSILCNKHHLKHDKLKEYIKTRDDVFAKIILDNPNMINDETKEKIKFSSKDEQRRILKKLFTGLLNGGGVDNNKKKYNIENASFLDELHKEIKTNLNSIITSPEYREINEEVRLKKERENDNYNINGSIMSGILCQIENEILRTIGGFFLKKGIKIGALIHDGLHVEKKSFKNKKHVQDMIDLTEKMLNSNFTNPTKDEKIVLVIKEMIIDDTFLEPDEETRKYLFHKNKLETSISRINNPFGFAFYEKEKQNYKLIDTSELRGLYKNYIYKFQNKKPFIDKWLSDYSMKTYERIEFNVKGNTEKKVLNTFTGFDIHNHIGEITDKMPKTQAEREELLGFFFKFLKQLTGNNEHQYTFFLNWISHVVSKPYIKNGVMVIMKGFNQGVGKNTIFLILQKIIGSNYCRCTARVDDVFDKHANARQNSLLICLNEVEYAQTKKYQGEIKNAITEYDYSIEPKGIDRFDYKSYEHYIVFSNKFNPIEIEEQNRRLFIINVDNADYGTKEEKNKLFSLIYNDFLGSGDKDTNWFLMKVLYDYLLQYYLDNDIENFKFQNNIETDESKILKTTCPMDDFIERSIIIDLQKHDKPDSEDEIKFKSNELFNEYIYYMNCNQYKAELNCKTFKSFLLSKYNNFVSEVRDKKGIFLVFKKQEIIKHFNIDIENIDDYIIENLIIPKDYKPRK